MPKKKETNIVHKVGRPSIYSKELADRICNELAQGISLRTVCKADDMPNMSTIFAWIREKDGFSNQYARAKQESADAMAEDILDIADATNQVIKSGAEKKSSAYAQAQRLRVDTRKWLMAKMKPKKYGDTIDVKSGGEPLPAAQIIMYSGNDRLAKVMEKRSKK